MKRLLFVLFACAGAARPQASSLGGSFVMPIDDESIRYSASEANDPVARLQRKIDRGEVTLAHGPSGYLIAILKALSVPVSSQALVFSRTSFQQHLISPSSPRALYFNDDVYVGSVRGSDTLEFSAVDPKLGGVFYTFDNRRTVKPKFVRRDECLQCHASPNTLGVPGHMVRSVFPDRDGFPQVQAGSFLTDHASPIGERWGGWYVTGTHGKQRHMGNVVAPDRDHADQLDREGGANVTSLQGRVDLTGYAAPDSDLVALMVLEHQTRLHNLLTRVSFETRVALNQQVAMNRALGRPEQEWSDSTRRRITRTTDVLVKYMLFTEEARLEAPVRGTSAFAREFAGIGPRDRQGRSLRDFDLDRRMFRYPLSYLIYSEAFDALPDAARDYAWRKLWNVLNGADPDKDFASLTPADRQAIREILLDTKPGLPEYWKAGPRHDTSADLERRPPAPPANPGPPPAAP